MSLSQITKTSCGSSVKIYKTLSKGLFKLLPTLHLDSYTYCHDTIRGYKNAL